MKTARAECMKMSTVEERIHLLKLFRVRVFFSRSTFPLYNSFCSVGLLGSKLLREVFSAILNRYVDSDHTHQLANA